MSDEPLHAAPKSVDLESFSEGELEHRIATLKQEIIDCERELEKKRAHRANADALFGSH